MNDIRASMRDGGFDAAFLAVGAHVAKRTDIPARDAGRILDAVKATTLGLKNLSRVSEMRSSKSSTMTSISVRNCTRARSRWLV